jgi:WD40 repeat protein
MSDVFISYSQKLPEPTESLATDLGARGYAYWYDTRLLPTDVFWRVIMKRITDAKAVIVIWSPPAVDSEWVYGEAKLAHEQKKLVCVRTEDVAPGAVPIPFNGYNVSPLTDRARIFAALEALKVPATGKGGFKAPKDDPVLAAPALAAADRASGEIATARAEIKDSSDPEDFAVFLKHYGDEHLFFAHMARKRVAKLRGTTVDLALTRLTGAVAQLPPAAKAEIEAVAKDVLLRIEAGMHTATINRISLTADGRMLATASHDKTVRLWSLPDCKLVRTLRPPIGPGYEGRVNAVALAPDGQWVAAGGWDVTWTASSGMFVTVFDTTTGAVMTRLGPLPNAVVDLEVSPRGDRLVAGLGDNGIRVWETKGWRQVSEDRDYADYVLGLAFAADGRLAATSLDGHVRLYGTDGRLAKKAKVPGGVRPVGVAFSPDGAQLAVGYDDTTRVDVLSGQTLAHLFSPDTSGVENGQLSSVAWFADGARLAAAGRYWAMGECPIFVWPDGGKDKRQAFPGSESTVMDLTPCGQGLAFGAADPAFGLLNADGKRVLLRGRPMADMRNKLREHLLVSADGQRARFGLGQGSKDPWLFDLASLKFAPSPTAPADLHAADISGLKVTGWESTTEPKLGGKALPLRQYETSRSLAIAPDAQSFVLGSEWSLRRFGKDAKQLWEKPVPDVVWGVNLAREGRLILAAYADGTIRWHRAADGEELLALFIHVPQDPKADKRWVLWTPEGYYTASPGAEDLIGWHVNRGPDQAADFYPADTFRSTFHKPDLVANALDKADR